MRVHVINLDRDKDRLAEFAATNAHLSDIIRFPAIDGQQVDIQEMARRGLVSDDILTSYSVGAVGAAMSHVSLWEYAASSGNTLTVAEDDAIFNSRFEYYAADVIKDLPSAWDFVLWGWNFDLFLSFEMLPGVSTCLAQFDQENMRTAIASYQTGSIAPKAFKLIWAFGIPCYTVSANGARALIDKCLPLRRFTASFPPAARTPLRASHFRNVGVDSAMNNVWPELNAHVCFPPLVVTKNDASKSTVQNV